MLIIEVNNSQLPFPELLINWKSITYQWELYFISALRFAAEANQVWRKGKVHPRRGHEGPEGE